MDARDRGTLEHRAIEQFVGKLYQQEGPVTDEMAEQMMMDILQPLFDEDGRNRPAGRADPGGTPADPPHDGAHEPSWRCTGT